MISNNIDRKYSMAAEEGGTLETMIFSFINKVTSEDKSIEVDGDGSNGSPVNLSVTVKTDASLEHILKFEFEENSESGEEPKPVIPGKHHLKVITTENGILIMKDGRLDFIEVPKQKAVLVIKQGGSYDWSAAPAEDAVLGIKDGSPEWYPIATCEKACEV